MTNFLHVIDPLYTASGFAVGALVGFTGVGGGSLMTPLLVLLFGIHPATAVGTDLLYAGLTKISGSIVHGFNGAIDWRVTRRLALGSVPAAALTLWALAHFGVDSKGASVAITTTLGFALILTAVTLLFRRRLLKSVTGFFDKRNDKEVAALTTVLGATLGVLVSISSVGAGAIGVTVLLMLYPKMPTVRIVGSDIAHAVPLTLIAGAGHWWIGSVDWLLLVSLLFGSIPGIAIGSHFASRVPDRVLRPLLAGTLALVGGKLVF
ncbi:MAG: sulfite exporter TauE/SafE family protein [Hyphomicrobiales bacterium]|nr:sulfite exporter TauE/SafE family protein [Hyphomicrobiales bacterium]